MLEGGGGGGGGVLAKQTNQEPKRRHRAKSSVADSMPGNLKAKKVTTTMIRQEDKENFKTNGAGDATFVGWSMILTSLTGVNENKSQSVRSILDQRTSTNSSIPSLLVYQSPFPLSFIWGIKGPFFCLFKGRRGQELHDSGICSFITNPCG